MSSLLSTIGVPGIIVLLIVGWIVKSIFHAGKSEEEKPEWSVPETLFVGLIVVIIILFLLGI